MTSEEFKGIYDKYFNEIRKYIYYRCGDADLSDDVVQQSFLRLWEKQITLMPGKEKALIYKIAGDEFVDQVRKRKYSTDFNKSFELIEDPGSTEDIIAYNELSNKLNRVLNNMKEAQRVAFLLSRKDGLSYSEIAARLNISVKAVEKRMNGALKELKRNLY